MWKEYQQAIKEELPVPGTTETIRKEKMTSAKTNHLAFSSFTFYPYCISQLAVRDSLLYFNSCDNKGRYDKVNTRTTSFLSGYSTIILTVSKPTDRRSEVTADNAGNQSKRESKKMAQR